MIQSDDDAPCEFRFGPFKLLPHRRLLLRGERTIPLRSQAIEILSRLVRNAGAVVGKNTLLESIWPGQFVHEGNLRVYIHSLRRALGETRPQPTYIATVAGRGYRFIPSVVVESAELVENACEVTPGAPRLPAQSAVIGRARDIDRIANALVQHRIVTLVGPGGVGKTTVAVSVAHQIRNRFADGVHFVDLSTTHDSARLPDVLAAALDLRGIVADPMDAIVEHLMHRRSLVVLDSCEHLLPAAAMAATRLHESGVTTRLLTTSREPLGLSVENVQPLKPLGVPPRSGITTAKEALLYPAVKLFATRALECANYQFSDSDASAVATLCSALDGLPLAIELAAARTGSGGASALLETLQEHRHHALLATLDRSYRRLSADETTILQLVSVFAESFDLDDVVAMTRVAGFDAYRTIVGLRCLVEKSLVTAESREQSVRYRLLDGTRTYAAERLREGSLAREAQLCHARLMLRRIQARRAKSLVASSKAAARSTSWVSYPSENAS